MPGPGEELVHCTESYLKGYAHARAAYTVGRAAHDGDPLAAALMNAVAEYGQQIAQRQSKEGK